MFFVQERLGSYVNITDHDESSVMANNVFGERRALVAVIVQIMAES